MKKLLLGSTAFASLLAGPAFAQLDLTISGSVDVHFGIVDEDLDVDRRSYGMTTDTILNFNAAGVMDNGLEYGSRINVDDTSGDSFKIDETWVYVSGSFGELRFGATDPLASELIYSIPTVGNGQSDGDFGRYVNDLTDDEFVFDTDFVYSSDDNKIVYIGDFGGLTAGLSYSPTDDSVGDDPAQTDNDSQIVIDADPGPPPVVTFELDFQLEDIFSVGANYKTEFNNVSLGVSGGANFADVEPGDISVPLLGLSVPIPGGDLTEYGFGGEVGFGAVTVGGFWIISELDLDNFGELEQDRYGAGVTFSTGPWGFAANALIAELDLGGGVDIEDTIYGLGVEYSLADGLTPYADLVFFDHEGLDPLLDSDGTVFLAGVTASF